MKQYIQGILFGLIIMLIAVMLQQQWIFNNRVVDLMERDDLGVEKLEKKFEELENKFKAIGVYPDGLLFSIPIVNQLQANQNNQE